jgi:hypothetical protein
MKMPTKSKPKPKRLKAASNIAPINQTYGDLKEGLHVAGYTFERACHRLKKLLSDDSWKYCSPAGFTDVDKFLNSLQLERFAKVAEERAEIARLIKHLRPEVSVRAIGRALKVPETTMRRIGAPKPQKAKKKQ